MLSLEVARPLLIVGVATLALAGFLFVFLLFRLLFYYFAMLVTIFGPLQEAIDVLLHAFEGFTSRDVVGHDTAVRVSKIGCRD